MDVSVEEFVDRILSDEAYQEPSNSGALEELDDEMTLPKWFDEKKYNQGRRFFWDFFYGFIMANMVGLVAVTAIPSITNVLAGSRRSNSPYTSYKRYVSTFLHDLAWYKYDLKPGSLYNICRETYEETRQVFQMVKDRVHTPCLENVPEYFEHLIHVAIDGLAAIVPGLEKTSLLYFSKYVADVPGYIYTETERITLQNRLRKLLQGKSIDTGVESSALMEKCAVDGLPKKSSRLFYPSDFSSMETVPAYKALPFIGKYKLALQNVMLNFYSTYIGRIILNVYIKLVLFLAEYFPFVAMWRFGVKKAFVNMFKEDPIDDTIPKPNSEYYKPQPPEPWYKCIISLFWS